MFFKEMQVLCSISLKELMFAQHIWYCKQPYKHRNLKIIKVFQLKFVKKKLKVLQMSLQCYIGDDSKAKGNANTPTLSYYNLHKTI